VQDTFLMKMLSKTELEFLKAPETFEADYRRTLRFRIKSKVEKIKSEIALLEANGISVTENCNGVTEFCNGQQNQKSANQSAFGEKWSLGRALIPRPLPYQGNAPPG
jgi:hypothetical protein